MNQFSECIDIWHGTYFGQEIQVRSNEVPGIMYGPTPGAKTFT